MTANNPPAVSAESNMGEPIAVIWYLLYEGDYQGPYSHVQICERLMEGRAGRLQHAWREGMPNWLPLEAIDEFRTLAAQAPAQPFSNWPASVDFISDEEPALKKERPNLPAKQKLSTPPRLDPSAFDASRPAAQAKAENKDEAWAQFFEVQKPLLTPREKRSEWLHKIFGRRPTRAAAAVTAACAASVGLALGLQILASSRVPELSDVSREEKFELGGAMNAGLKSNGPAVAIAVSQLDAFAPYFYLASNLPDGTRLDVLIEGKPETLLENLRVSVRANVTVQNGIARTPPFRQDNGAPFPRGEYRIVISCATCEPGAVTGQAAKPLAQKTYFLGGLRNQEYDFKLKSFHDHLRAQAQEELTELKQVADTLETQAKDSVREYQQAARQARNANSKAQAQAVKAWKEFDRGWLHLQDQLKDLFNRWTPEALDASYYHANLYALLKSTGERVAKLHRIEGASLSPDGASEPRPTEAALASEYDLVVRELKSLREKIQTVQTLPATASGMPQKLP